ncbi:MAG: AtpZ/AtpI family protein [Pseudomonadota bacterium]
MPRLPPTAVLASSLVLEMSGLIIGGLLLGAWLDRRLGTAPILMAVLPFVGLVAGCWRILRVLQAQTPRDDP